MTWDPSNWHIIPRSAAPHGRPREYNDPSKSHEAEQVYDHSLWPARLRTAVALVMLLALLAFIAFIVFNLVIG